VQDHFVSTIRAQARRTSKAMEIRIRKARSRDLEHIVHHRLAMFEKMEYPDAAILDRVHAVSRDCSSEALRHGVCLGWMAEQSAGQVVGGGGMVGARTGQAVQARIMRRGLGFQPVHRARSEALRRGEEIVKNPRNSLLVHAEIFDVGVAAKAGVEEQIPARMMVVVVDVNLIVVPLPIAATVKIVGSHDPVGVVIQKDVASAVIEAARNEDFSHMGVAAMGIRVA